MNTLRKVVNEKDEESRKRQSLLDAKLQELELIKQNLEGSFPNSSFSVILFIIGFIPQTCITTIH